MAVLVADVFKHPCFCECGVFETVSLYQSENFNSFYALKLELIRHRCRELAFKYLSGAVPAGPVIYLPYIPASSKL